MPEIFDVVPLVEVVQCRALSEGDEESVVRSAVTAGEVLSQPRVGAAGGS
ncbi:hypothetical protein [Actinoplanes sp. NPDC051411]